MIGFSPAAIVWHFRRNTVKAYCNQQRGYGKAEALVYSKHPFRFNLFGQAKWLGRIYGDLSASLLLSRRPVIYSGIFGRGLFQTLYEPPSSLTAFLPLTFEWSAASIVLALAGLVGGGWWLLLAVPLLATWAMCVNGAMKAPIDKRFAGPKARSPGGVIDLSRPIAARLGADQMARARDACAASRGARDDRAKGTLVVARSLFPTRLLERGGRRQRGADRWSDEFFGAAEILCRARYRVERLGFENCPRVMQPRARPGLHGISRRR